MKSGLTVFKDIYVSAKKKVTKIVHDAKSAYYSSQVQSSVTSKQLFNVCNRLSGKVKESLLPTVYPVTQLPQIFCDYFTKKVSDIRAHLDCNDSVPPVNVDDSSHVCSTTFDAFQPVSEEEVRKVILQSKPTTCQLDPIPTPLLLQCLDCTLPTITHLSLIHI